MKKLLIFLIFICGLSYITTFANSVNDYNSNTNFTTDDFIKFYNLQQKTINDAVIQQKGIKLNNNGVMIDVKKQIDGINADNILGFLTNTDNSKKFLTSQKRNNFFSKAELIMSKKIEKKIKDILIKQGSYAGYYNYVILSIAPMIENIGYNVVVPFRNKAFNLDLDNIIPLYADNPIQESYISLIYNEFTSDNGIGTETDINNIKTLYNCYYKSPDKETMLSCLNDFVYLNKMGSILDNSNTALNIGDKIISKIPSLYNGCQKGYKILQIADFNKINNIIQKTEAFGEGYDLLSYLNLQESNMIYNQTYKIIKAEAGKVGFKTKYLCIKK